MQTDKKKIWFPAKKYGVGWDLPCAWQGWVVYAIWWVLLLGGGIFLAPRNVGLFVAYAMVLTIALILVVVMKGEKLRWRWGRD